MPKVQYGDREIEYSFLEKDNLKSHYITVEKGEGVILKGKSIPEEQARQLIIKKAKWIIDKLNLVESFDDEDIVTGSRIQYLGRKYYIELIIDNSKKVVWIDFNESKFKVYLPQKLNYQSAIRSAFNIYFIVKAKEKITPRIKKWSKETGLSYKDLRFRRLKKQWGSCTPQNTIIINTETIKLPYTLIDYLIVHELCHTKIKNHSKMFWAEVSKHIPHWKDLDEQMKGMRM
jgi:predicted metal-dependent hydrolase